MQYELLQAKPSHGTAAVYDVNASHTHTHTISSSGLGCLASRVAKADGTTRFAAADPV